MASLAVRCTASKYCAGMWRKLTKSGAPFCLRRIGDKPADGFETSFPKENACCRCRRSANVRGSNRRFLVGLVTGKRPSPPCPEVFLVLGRVQTKCSVLRDSKCCWKCGKTRQPLTDVFFCSCGAILPAIKVKDYFGLLGCEKSFDIDVEMLTERYKDLQWSLHPDKFSQSSQKEREFSEEQSALVNNAYRILLKPLLRGIYLLELNGEQLEEGDYRDMDFLQKIMEINENIEAAKSAAEVKKIKDLNTQNLNQCLVILSEAFRKDNIASAKEILIKLKYYTNIDDKTKQLKELE